MSSNLYNVTNVKGTLFFTVFNGIDQVLWKSDGTAAGTMQLKDMNPGGRNVYWYKEFENAGGTLIFSFYDDIHGSEIWKSDGTEAGTVIIKEITAGVYSAQPSNITYIGNGVSLFLATDEKKGFELWKTDGTESGTNRVKDIKLTSSYSSDPFMLTANSDKTKLLFGASDTKYGNELRITDGTEAGTGVVKDLFKGMFSSYPSNAINFKEDTYFFADILDTTVHNTSDVRTIRKLCKTNGTPGGTKIFSLPSLEAALNGSANVYAMGATSDLLYMIFLNYSAYQFELWRTDGTDSGTYAIKTDMPYYYGSGLKAVGNKMFFISYDLNYGSELFVTDGSIAGTTMVKDINPGFNGTNLSNLTSYNGKLYFTADVGYGPFFWSSDGTDKGTTQMKPAIIAYTYYNNSFVQANGRLFFSGLKNVGTGTELYSFDGINTTLVKDLFKGAGSSGIIDIVGGDTVCYFFANDGKHGQELWKSNGTKEGTRLVKDITDFGDTYAANLITVHNELFFTIYDVLWQSDGTKNGTYQVNDAGLSGVSGLGNFTAFDNKLAFTAFEPSTGQELYVGEVTGAGLTIAKATDAADMKTNTTTFSAKLYPNPVHSKASVEISGKMKNLTIILSDMSGKLLWQSSRINQSRIDLPTERLSSGVYVVTIKNGDESKTLKLVKE
ncbi:MAG TPA: T9SS type A sorting domain-containing protein [Parafilimonas sp.]|nr:T9SS type A sorting domain-containing protein [Parafilimonas sp.]